LYAGFGCVLTGIFLYEPPTGTWEGEVPALSPAVACTVTLASTFFLVYFLHAVSVTYRQITKSDNSKFEASMENAANTLALAPMLCVLFLGARMRALQMDPVGGNPQSWAQNCFYAVSSALVLQACMSVILPFIIAGTESKKTALPEGDVEYTMPEGTNWMLVKVITFIRWFIMISVYVGGVAVVCSVFTIEHPDGKEHTPAISPTMLCVTNLAFQYFLIYFLLWVVFTAKDLGATWGFLDKAAEAVESAKSTVQFAPMLCVLFIATRMRALQITDNKGAPQGWVQDGMYLASWSILIQFVMCLLMPIFTNKTYKADTLPTPGEDDTEVDANQASKNEAPVEAGSWGAYVVSFIRYVALVALIGGLAAVITGVFLMTPETANGRGSIPLVSDGTLPVDLAPAPPAITDLPGAEGGMEATGSTIGAGVDGVNDAADVVASPVEGAVDATSEAVVG